jgi:tRNA pseudouridine55 synthase
LNKTELTLDSLKSGSILLINKPHKWTSFDVVNYIRKSIDVKIGHAGTLDPLATGLLILCTGKLTKQIDNYQGMDKEYTGTIVLGKTTPSFDLETEISETKDITYINDSEIFTIASNFIGVQSQIAPLYSAKKIDGNALIIRLEEAKWPKSKPEKLKLRSLK